MFIKIQSGNVCSIHECRSYWIKPLKIEGVDEDLSYENDHVKIFHIEMDTYEGKGFTVEIDKSSGKNLSIWAMNNSGKTIDTIYQRYLNK